MLNPKPLNPYSTELRSSGFLDPTPLSLHPRHPLVWFRVSGFGFRAWGLGFQKGVTQRLRRDGKKSRLLFLGNPDPLENPRP